jgi:hypothetical protein
MQKGLGQNLKPVVVAALDGQLAQPGNGEFGIGRAMRSTYCVDDALITQYVLRLRVPDRLIFL